MLIAMAAAALAAAALSYFGVFVILRRVVFVGVAVAQVSSAGVALGIFLGVNPLAFSVSLTVAAVLIIAFSPGGRRIPREAVLGVLFVAGAAAALLLLSGSATSEARSMDILFGSVLAVGMRELYISLAVFIPALAVQILFFKEFLLVAHDRETAAALGYNTVFWDALFFMILGGVISAATMIVGVLVTFAFLVAPAAAALLFSAGLKKSIVISVLFGLAATLGGFYVSYYADLSPGPALSAAACALMAAPFIKSLFIRLKRTGDARR